MTPDIVTLSRSEVAHLADALDLLVARHGSARRAADALGLPRDLFTRARPRPASLGVLPATLAAVAAALSGALGAPVTVLQLRRGRVPPAPPASSGRGPYASTTRGQVVVRR